jgi:hypothetical protein
MKNYVTANALKMEEEEATQQCNGQIETWKKRKIYKKKIRSDNGESRDRAPPDSQT